MATGNGFFAEGKYQPKSTQTWDSLVGNWDAYIGWEFTPALPLTYTTNIIDFGAIEYINFLTDVQCTGKLTTTIYYGNTVDSSGGSIDGASSVTYTVGDTPVAVKARYFQFLFSVDYPDSAGADPTPAIFSIDTDLSTRKITVSLDSIDSSTLNGSVGQRELVLEQSVAGISTAVITPHLTSSTAKYVVDNYVASVDSAGELYVEEVVSTGVIPYVAIDKTTDPITVNIYNLDTYGKTAIDCTFDAFVTGLPSMTVDTTGNIVEG